MRGQLREIARGLDIVEVDAAAEPAHVHAALASGGLLSHLGLRVGESREYLGARNVRFAIAPGWFCARKPPRWVIAAELVETRRLLARTVARIEPESLEQLAAHLVGRSHSEPTWDARRGSVTAIERVVCMGCRSSLADGRPSARSTRSRPGNCSSGTRWSRAIGSHHTASWCTTAICWPRSMRWRSAAAAATCWSTMRPCMPSTTREYRPRSSRPNTSTPGGSRPGTAQS